MRAVDLTYINLPQFDYVHVTNHSFHMSMFFLCLFLPLSVEILDSPKASPGELTFPVSDQTFSMAKGKKASQKANVKAGGKKKHRAPPLLERPVENALGIFDDDSTPATPAARSPMRGEDLGLDAIFG